MKERYGSYEENYINAFFTTQKYEGIPKIIEKTPVSILSKGTYILINLISRDSKIIPWTIRKMELTIPSVFNDIDGYNIRMNPIINDKTETPIMELVIFWNALFIFYLLLSIIT